MGLGEDHANPGDDPPGASTTANALGDGMFAGSLTRVSPTIQHTDGGQRLQPVFWIVCQASIACCRSIRRRVIGSGGRDGTELDVRTQNNNLCNRSKEFSLIHLDQIWAEPWAT